MTELAVVVPVLDEAAELPGLMDALHTQTGVTIEIIVADGGSSDDSTAIAAAAGARVVHSTRGRATQMNAGAATADAPWLLFLHADCRPTTNRQLADALAALRNAPTPHTAGHFALRFTGHGDRHVFLYRYMEAKSASNRPHTVNGDQGLLIARDWFFALGGFDDALLFLEDQRLAARIHLAGCWVLLPGTLTTSARRFETEGPRRRYLLMAIIMAMHAIDMRTFFERAPAVYRAQPETGPLLVTPYFRLLRRLMREMGLRESLRRWYAVGGFVLEQSWQPFFALDVALARRPGRGRTITRVHDRAIAPVIRNRLGQAAATVLAIIVSMGILAPLCRWGERKALRRCPAAGKGDV